MMLPLAPEENARKEPVAGFIIVCKVKILFCEKGWFQPSEVPADITFEGGI
jgi:hypothetical protein